MRRVLLPASLVLACLFAVPGAAVPREPSGLTCPSFSDPAKDDRNADLRSFEDPALDILHARLSITTDRRLVVELTMRQLGDPTWAEGVQYAGGFRYGLKDIELFGTVAWSNDYTKSFLALQGIRIDHSYELDTNEQVTMTLDPARRKVTLSAELRHVEEALGEKLRGLGRDVRATTAGNYVVFGEPYDVATTFTPLRFAGCR